MDSLNSEHLPDKNDIYYHKVIAENSLDIISIMKLNGHCIYVSPSCSKVLGYNSSELIGTSIYNLLPPDEVDTIKNKLRILIRENSENSFEHRIRKKDNTFLWVESKGSLFSNEVDKSEKQLMIISRDISERKIQEEELIKLSKAVEQSPNSIVITDINGNLEYVNKSFEKISGYSSHEVKGKNPRIFQSGYTSNVTYNELWKTLSNGETWEGQLLNRKKSGEEYWESVSISPIKDKEGIVKYYLGIKEDITEQKKNLDLLKSSENKFRQVWEDSADGMRLSDESGKIIAVNKAYCEMVGLDKNKLEGFHITTPYEQESHKRIMEKYSEQFNKDIQKSKYQSELVLLDGQKVFYDVTTSLLKISETEKYMLSIIRDFTEKRLIVKKLKLNERKLSQALEATHAGMWDWDMKENKIYYSSNLLKLLGYEENELDVENTWKLTTHPEDLNFLLNCLNEHFENKLPYYETEFRKVKKTGEIIWVLDRGSIIERDELGNPLRMTGTMIDITRSKIDELALERSEEKFKSLFNSAADSIFLLDLSGYVLDVNEIGTTLLGVARDQIIGKNLKVFLNNNHDVINKKRFSELIKYNHTIFEEKFYSPAGSENFIEISAKFIQYLDEKVILCIGRDITERKAAEQEILKAKIKAEELNRFKSNFLANMSHELRTPLVGILGFADILSAELENTEHKEMSETILKSGRRLLETLSNILNLSKIESGKNEVHLKKTDVNNAIKDTVHLFSVAAKFKGLDLKFIPNPEVIYSELDEHLLGVVLNNLLNNAIKFTDHGKITITLKINPSDQTKLLIDVSDTGIGIPEEFLNYVFEEFRQASEGFSRRFEGTGLGLTVTKRFVELMNGKITVKSKLKSGTTFTLEFPVYKNPAVTSDDTKPESDLQISSKKSTRLKKRKALIVEDDSISKHFLTACIKNYFDIDDVKGGQEALAAVSEKRYDAIFMDINLGRSMDGIEATRKIRELPDFSATPIIAVTAYASEEDKQEFLANGCSHYISKPYTRNQIIDLIETVFDS